MSHRITVLWTTPRSNSFLVRHPGATLPSLARHWPDFTDEEAGWMHLAQAADVVETLGEPLVVVEADALCRDPEGVVLVTTTPG